MQIEKLTKASRPSRNRSRKDLEAQLAQLENEQFVRRVDSPDLTYIFKHLLTQETVYQSLLVKRRREIHLRVAKCYEQLYSDRPDEFAALLAQHYAAAGDEAKTFEYAIRAGDAAARVYANTEAIAQYTLALQVMKNAPTRIQSEQLIHIYSGRGRVLELSGKYEQALASYQELESLGRERGERTIELASLLARATIFSTPTPVHDPARAQVLLQQALALARQLNDRAAESRVLWNLMLLNIFAGEDPRQAIAYGEQSLTLARALNLREQLAFTLNDLFYAYVGIGNTERAQQVAEEARALWRQLGNQPMLADNLSNSVTLHVLVGDYERALACAEEALQISQSISNVWGQTCSRWLIGHVYLERGQLDKALEIMEEAIRLGEQTSHPGAIVATRADLGWIYGTLGAHARGLELAQLARARSVQVQNPLFRSWAIADLARLHLLNGDLSAAQAAVEEGYRNLRQQSMQILGPILLALTEGELALAQQDYGRVIAVMDDLIARMQKEQSRPFIPDALYVKGKALLGQGQTEAARKVLAQGREEAEALGSRRSLWPILVTLSDIEAQRGNAAEAQTLLNQSREHVQFIADHIGNAELRDSFLHLPEVRAVIGDFSP